MFGGLLGDESVLICLYVAQRYGQNVTACVHVCALNVPVVC